MPLGIAGRQHESNFTLAGIRGLAPAVHIGTPTAATTAGPAAKKTASRRLALKPSGEFHSIFTQSS